MSINVPFYEILTDLIKDKYGELTEREVSSIIHNLSGESYANIAYWRTKKKMPRLVVVKHIARMLSVDYTVFLKT
jgi:hypothetical protein